MAHGNWCPNAVMQGMSSPSAWIPWAIMFLSVRVACRSMNIACCTLPKLN